MFHVLEKFHNIFNMCAEFEKRFVEYLWRPSDSLPLGNINLKANFNVKQAVTMFSYVFV